MTSAPAAAAPAQSRVASASASKGVAVRGWGNAGPPLPAWEDGTTPPRGEAGVPRGHRNPRGGRVAVRLRVPRSSPTPGQEGRAGRAARHAGRRRGLQSAAQSDSSRPGWGARAGTLLRAGLVLPKSGAVLPTCSVSLCEQKARLLAHEP